MNNNKVVFMFSGQGSQYFGMGSQLYEKDTVFRKSMDALDEIYIDRTGLSVVNQIINSSYPASAQISDIMVTHPSIVMVQYSLFKMLTHKGVLPDYVMGYSLGEYIAAAATGSIGIEDVLDFVINQAKVLDNSRVRGSMLSIMSSSDKVHEILNDYPNCHIAAENFSNHQIISGSLNDINNIMSILFDSNIAFQKIAVEYPFHSPLMDPLKEIAINYFSRLSPNEPEFPIISCQSTGLINKLSPDYLWNVVSEPVMFKKTIDKLERSGSYSYVDLSPTSTLSNFVKYNICDDDNSEVFSAMSIYGDDEKSCQEVVSLLSMNHIHSNSVNGVSTMSCFIFPGQGSQKKGMGLELFSKYPDLVKKADEILGYSIEELCVNDLENRLSNTQYTQPALFVVSVLSFLNYLDEGHSRPDYVAGHSLGEYAALYAAGVFDFEVGLKLVKKRGEILSKAADGSMAAVLNCDIERLQELLTTNNLNSIDIANLNTPRQTVISGPKVDIEHALKVFNSPPISIVPLNVSAAFHSRYMKKYVKEFAAYISNFELSEPKIPVISNVSAKPYSYEAIKTLLCKQISSSVHWVDTIRYLMACNVANFVEIGPGDVLTKMTNTVLDLCQPIDFAPQGDESSLSHSDADKSRITEVYSQSQTISQINPPSFKFSEYFGVTSEYIVGSVRGGITSSKMVENLSRDGLLGFYGASYMPFDQVKLDVLSIKESVNSNNVFGVGLTYTPSLPSNNSRLLNFLSENNVSVIELSGFPTLTDDIIKYRVSGLVKSGDVIQATNKIVVKVSRIDQLKEFLSPISSDAISELVAKGELSPELADSLQRIPMVDAVAVTQDFSLASPFAMFSTYKYLVDDAIKKHKYVSPIYVGISGGVADPSSAAAALTLGADFILTDVINQCTIEADLADNVKDMLSQATIDDIEYVPSEDLFEIGGVVPVLRKGGLFSTRANRIYQLWRQFGYIDNLPSDEKDLLFNNYLNCDYKEFDGLLSSSKGMLADDDAYDWHGSNRKSISTVLEYYLNKSFTAAKNGDIANSINFNIHCSQDVGMLNNWLKQISNESWRNWSVCDLSREIMSSAKGIANNYVPNKVA